MKKWFVSNKLYLLGAIIGAIGGYLYWALIGCSSGTCPITSKPLNSTIYGALLGALLFGLFKREDKKTEVERK
ncbi:MAG: DUF6132 family protein [Sphingobacteriales bacterium]